LFLGLIKKLGPQVIRARLIYFAAVLILLVSIELARRFSETPVDAIGIIGSGASVFGILIAIEQSLQAKTSSVAAREAAERTASRLRTSYYRYALLHARRFLSDSVSEVAGESWKHAAVRLRDAADEFMDVANSRKVPDHFFLEAARGARQWAAIISKGTTRNPPELDDVVWTEWCSTVLQRVAQEAGPFDAAEVGEE
jgi:hypothetical protein